MKNFTCPNCKAAATLKDIVPNKKLREIISWFKELTNDNTINIQNQNAAGSQLNIFNNLNNASYLNNLKGFTPPKSQVTNICSTSQGKDLSRETMNSLATGPYSVGVQNPNTTFETSQKTNTKENLIDEKLNFLKIQTAAKSNMGSLTPTAKENLNFQSFGSDDKKINSVNSNLKSYNPNNLFSNHENNLNSNTNNSNMQIFQENLAHTNKTLKDVEKTKESFEDKIKTEKILAHSKTDQNENFKNDINKIEFKKENNMTPEEKMQLYNKINSDSSVSGSLRKHSEEINEASSQKGNISK